MDSALTFPSLLAPVPAGISQRVCRPARQEMSQRLLAQSVFVSYESRGQVL